MMKLINIGFGNMVSATRLVAIVSPESAPICRIITKAKESNMLVDATYGRRSRSVLITDSDHVILSPIQPETIANRLSSDLEEEEEEEPSITDMSFTVTQQKGGVFVVEGPAIQRLIDSVNFEDEESMNWFHRQLRDRGIIDELRKKGAKEGSPVQLGDMEFDFIE